MMKFPKKKNFFFGRLFFEKISNFMLCLFLQNSHLNAKNDLTTTWDFLQKEQIAWNHRKAHEQTDIFMRKKSIFFSWLFEKKFPTFRKISWHKGVKSPIMAVFRVTNVNTLLLNFWTKINSPYLKEHSEFFLAKTKKRLLRFAHAVWKHDISVC